METILLDILLFLGVIWLLLGIAYLWKICLRPVPKSVDETTGKPIVTKEQVEHARHVLVGRSKPFTSPSVPEIPAVSSSENSVDNPSTFATQNVRKEDETESTVTPQSAPEHTDEKEEDNEMQVDYTMDEPDEDTIIREELQIADDSLPEVSPSSILARDIIRVNGWHRNDDALDEESETEVHETLQAIRGTELMEYMKEVALGQEQDHQKLLAAIRKVEETELQENDTEMTSAPGTDNENNNEEIAEEKPLSYYL
mgnify:CR=1 FL=1